MTEKKEGKDKKDAKDPKKGAKDEKDKKDPKDAKKGGKDEKDKKVTLDDKKKGKDEKTKSSSDEGKIKDKKGKKDAKKGKGRRHKKKKPEPVEPIKMPRWFEWCEKNSKPKRWYYPRQRMEPTRWQKRGPMKAKQWKQFFKWAAEKAEPRKYSFEKPPPPPELDAKGRPIVEPPPEPIDYEAQLARATELAQPVRPREKYQYPKKPKYPYRPTFDQRFPAKPERGRPFKPPGVPAEFQHWLIELEFWETVRFPISKAALKAVASQRTKELAQPRELPKVPHCPLPPPPEPEYIPPRKKMTMKQWRAHLRKLQYLAKPNVRPLFYHC